MRVHIEPSPDGLVLWLGIDGRPEARAMRTAAVVAELRRLLSCSGERVATVVCNGELTEAIPLFVHKEP